MPVDIDAIRGVCDPLGIVVIEDSACAAGSTYKGRPAGSGAELTTWSFHPRKILTTGEGGMLTTSRPDWADRARRLREHAMSVSATERHLNMLSPPEQYVEIGFNYRMTDLQAAVGIVQLGRLDDIVRRRREIAAAYSAEIDGIVGLRAVADPSFGEANFQSYWVEVLPEYGTTRDGLLEALADAEISARRGIMAAHRQPAYSHVVVAPDQLPVTEHLTDSTLILPVFHQMTDHELERVVEVLRSAARRPG